MAALESDQPMPWWSWDQVNEPREAIQEAFLQWPVAPWTATNRGNVTSLRRRVNVELTQAFLTFSQHLIVNFGKHLGIIRLRTRLRRSFSRNVSEQ